MSHVDAHLYGRTKPSFTSRMDKRLENSHSHARHLRQPPVIKLIAVRLGAHTPSVVPTHAHHATPLHPNARTPAFHRIAHSHLLTTRLTAMNAVVAQPAAVARHQFAARSTRRNAGKAASAAPALGRRSVAVRAAANTEVRTHHIHTIRIERVDAALASDAPASFRPRPMAAKPHDVAHILFS